VVCSRGSKNAAELGFQGTSRAKGRRFVGLVNCVDVMPLRQRAHNRRGRGTWPQPEPTEIHYPRQSFHSWVLYRIEVAMKEMESLALVA